MNVCSQDLLIERYHDGELGASLRRQVEEHLLGCPACAAHLAELRQISQSLKGAGENSPGAEMLPIELARMHAAVGPMQRRVGEWELLRIGVPFSAVAAALLLATSAMLIAHPAASAPGAEDWEQVATGSGHAGMGNASRELSAWMVSHLGGQIP